MTRVFGAGLIAVMLLAGCSTYGTSPSASPAFTPQAECERNGGWWRAEMNFCEYQSPEPPQPPRRH
jgi:hypothetical protein